MNRSVQICLRRGKKVHVTFKQEREMKELPYGYSGISFRRSCFSKHRLHHYLTSCWGTSTWKPTYGVSHKANSRHQGRSLHKAVFPRPASSALIPANSSREPWYLGAHRRRQDELLILLTTILCCEGHSSGLGVWWINGMRLRKKTVAEEEIDDWCSLSACSEQESNIWSWLRTGIEVFLALHFYEWERGVSLYSASRASITTPGKLYKSLIKQSNFTQSYQFCTLSFPSFPLARGVAIKWKRQGPASHPNTTWLDSLAHWQGTEEYPVKQ